MKNKQFIISPEIRINCLFASDKSCWIVRDSAHKKLCKLYPDKIEFYIEDSIGSLYLFKFQGVNRNYSIVVKG